MTDSGKIAAYLSEKYGPWGWMGQRAHDAAGINLVLPLDFIISCDYGAEVPYFYREEDVFSVEKRKGLRKNWSNEDLKLSLNGELGQRIIEKWNSYRGKVNLLCYRSVERLESDIKGLARRPRIFAVPVKLKRHFDNKILLHRALKKLSLPCISGKVKKLGGVTFNSLRKELSLPFVIQFPYGSSGNFTFILREAKEFERLRETYPESTVLIRKYMDGYALNANAMVLSSPDKARVICAMPSVQITGRPECSNTPATFCGNDYAASTRLDPGVKDQIADILRTVGAWMAEAGYRGVFGMDFVTKKGTVYPVEINPRFQNSTSIQTMLSIRSGKASKGTIFLLHIAEFLRGKDKKMKDLVDDFPDDGLMYKLEGSQIIIHSGMERCAVTGELHPGIYRLEGDELVFLRNASMLVDCGGKEDILITCGVPKPGTTIEPNSTICKVQMLRSVLDEENKKKFTPEARKIISCVYKKLRLRESAVAADAGMAVKGGS